MKSPVATRKARVWAGWTGGFCLAAAVFFVPWTGDAHLRLMSAVATVFLSTWIASRRVPFSLLAGAGFSLYPIYRMTAEWVSFDNPHATGEAVGILSVEVLLVLGVCALGARLLRAFLPDS